MAEDFTPPEEDYTPDEAEIIDMKNRDSWEQTQDGFAKPPEQETSFDEKLPVAPDTIENIERDDKLIDFYLDKRKKGYIVDKYKPLMNKALPIMNDKKDLFMNYDGKDYRLTKKITRMNFSHMAH